MDIDHVGDWFSVVQAGLNIAAILVAGIWASRNHLLSREREPRAEFEVDVSFVGRQNGYWLVEVNSFIENKGFVRFSIRDMRLRLRYLTSNDAIWDGNDDVRHQVLFPHSTDAQGLVRIVEKTTYVNPKLRYRYSYITWIPEEATFLLVHCKFKYWNTVSTAQKLFAVPGRDREGVD